MAMVKYDRLINKIFISHFVSAIRIVIRVGSCKCLYREKKNVQFLNDEKKKSSSTIKYCAILGLKPSEY